MTEIKEGEIVLCTVKSIVGTTVFVKIEDNGDGSIVTSEVSSGRIRNLRDFVVPNKRIVCKVLRVMDDRIDLSLRRVVAKERDAVIEKYEKERNAVSIIKSIVGNNFQQVVDNIKNKNISLYNFLQENKDNPDNLKKFFSKEEIEKLLKILKEKKEKEKTIKQGFYLKSKLADGFFKIKEVLKEFEDKISYIAGGEYVLSIKAGNFKEGNLFVKKAMEDIEKKARKSGMEFSVKK